MTMFCPDEERLSAWVDRELPPADDESVSTHLAACEVCRRAVTIAFLVDRESPQSLSEEGQHRLFETVQGALAEPPHCVSDERLAAWLHDGLGPLDRASVTDHLAECDDCRRAAALTRLSNTEPVSALGALQEERALKVVLRSAGRDAFFSFWRVVAASFLVAIAVTYVAVQWSGPPRIPPTTATNPPGDGRSPGAMHYDSGAPTPDLSATIASPNIPVSVKGPELAPGKPEEAPAPARFQAISVFESEGLPSAAPGRLSYSEVLRSKGVASVNVEGRALVVLDNASEARLAYAADAGAYVVEIARGRVFIDTAGADQSWEVRGQDRTVTLRSFRGRAAAEVEAGGLRVRILRGVADVGPRRIDAGRGVDVQPNSSVVEEDQQASCAALAERYGIIRPRTLLVLRAAAGTTSNDGPWRYTSRSRKAEPLKDADALIPECVDPIRWIVIALDEPLKFTSDMVLRAACGGTGAKICLWVGGQGGWHREVARSATGTSPEEWSLRGLRREMVDLVAGEDIRKIMMGVVQERGREHSLEVDTIEIRRVLD
ncbi:MAG TPA: zf-HC2 domain-containing protein [Planctomycetota bacterium]|nr:zf-HC2 domain-containing protein [Planctomycetota bacterium]